MEKPKKPCCKEKAKVASNKTKSTISTDDVVIPTVETNNFKLRSDLGVSKISFSNGLSITKDNAPDEVCIEFLKANPNRISMFEKFPENWNELINDNAKENENE